MQGAVDAPEVAAPHPEEPQLDGPQMAVRADEPAWKSQPVAQRRLQFALGLIAVVALAVLGVKAVTGGEGDSVSLAGTTADTSIVQTASLEASAATEAEPASVEDEGVDVDGALARFDGGCTIEALSLRLSSNGDGVTCLQEALSNAGHFTAAANGVFDDSTLRAVMEYQTANDLFVDGVVGRESAVELGIWPDEESLVTRTPPPPDGATDLWGVALSPVASAGEDAPPLPEDSGEGRRVVYDRAGQRVWAVRDDGVILRSWLVSGSTYQNEIPGTHEVYSRSEMSTAWNGKAYLPQMIRWLKTERGAIGFHAIPLHVSDNSPYQGSEELGTRLSGGCQRQHNWDAEFLWAFATLGTTVVVT